MANNWYEIGNHSQVKQQAVKTKVFGIGLSKTGTTSLTAIFKIAGYRSVHYPRDHQYRNLQNFDFACDQPICVRYKEIYSRFPDAHFIYTDRNIDDWLDSCKRHWSYIIPNDFNKKRRVEVFGTYLYDEILFKKVYQKHKEDVFDFFKDKKLISINLCENIGLDQLWPIIGMKIENIPKLNVNSELSRRRS